MSEESFREKRQQEQRIRSEQVRQRNQELAEEASNIPFLDEKKAREVLGREGDVSVFFAHIKLISPEAARVIVENEKRLGVLNLGLEKLPGEVAVELAEYTGNLILENIKEMDWDATQELQDFHGDSLDILIDNLDEHFIEELVKLESPLGLKTANLNNRHIAKLIADRKFETSLDASEIDAGCAEILSDHQIGSPLEILYVRINLELAKVFEEARSKLVIYPRYIDEKAEKLLKKAPNIELDLSQLEDYIRAPKEKLGKTMEALPEGAIEQIPDWMDFYERHYNFKDLVARSAEEPNQFLRERGVAHPDAFRNLNARFDIVPLFHQVEELSGILPKGRGFDYLKQLFQDSTGKALGADEEFFSVYKDEVIQAIADYLHEAVKYLELQKKKQADLPERIKVLEGKLSGLQGRARKKLERNLENLRKKTAEEEGTGTDNNLGRVNALLAKFADFEYIRPGQGGFRLGRRNRDELTLGDECSDCTSAGIGGMNFWTVPTWQADPCTNFLLQYDEKGNLAHKFTAVWEINGNGEVILTIDSLEVGNEQKEKAGMYKDVQSKAREKRLMDEAINFFHKWAEEMGLDRNMVFATMVSNTGTDELEKFPNEKMRVAKIGGVKYAAMTRQLGDPDFSGPEPKIYLQSYKFSGEERPEEAKAKFSPQEAFNMVEQKLREYKESAPVDDKDLKKIKKIQETARENPQKAGRMMNIFLIMEASPITQKALTVEGQRMDVFLNNNKLSMVKYFEDILAETKMTMAADAMHGPLEETKLYHLTEAN